MDVDLFNYAGLMESASDWRMGWQDKGQSNKRPMGNIANQNIKSHNEISLMESYTKYLFNAVEYILY